ncbi:MAG: phosphopantothenate/pantothenate synthetase [Candidatus Hermodarchaeota archaeon]
MTKEIPEDHPRAESLRVRHKLTEGMHKKIVAEAGLIAAGRGEAFDYLIGEKTIPPALKAIKAATAVMMLANSPVISVNGNVAAIAAEDVVKVSKALPAQLEINLFYYRPERVQAIEQKLQEAGAERILKPEIQSQRVPGLSSDRAIINPEGISKADVILVPLEDGDRTEALRRLGKTVISIDLNPLSRTAQYSTMTIVDNVVRVFPVMLKMISSLNEFEKEDLRKIVSQFDNRENLRETLSFIKNRLAYLSEVGIFNEFDPHNQNKSE